MNRKRFWAVLVAVAAMALVGVLGTLAPAQTPAQTGTSVPVVGRRTSVCPVQTPDTATKVSVGAVVIKPGPTKPGGLAGTGSLTGRLLSASKPALTVPEAGRGELLGGPEEPVVLQASGSMAASSGAAVFSDATDGPDRGLSMANCAAPATEDWVICVGSSEDHRTELVLTNADNSQAVVDLRFFGPDGVQRAPGGVGIAVPGQSSRTVALEPLVHGLGPLSVRVHTSTGRIAATARDQQSNRHQPAGAAWVTSAAAPSRAIVIAGIPGGTGERELVVVNPNDRRTRVTVQALGADGSFAPAAADTVEVGAQSSASVRLDQALDGEPVAIRLSADQPVTGTVRSTSSRKSSAPDLAVQPAGQSLSAQGLAPLAVTSQTSSILSLTNAGPAKVTVGVELVGYDGKSLLTDTLTLLPGTTRTKRLPTAASAYLVADPPAGSSVYGDIIVTENSGQVAGLATSPLRSPNVAAGALETTADPDTAGSTG